MIKESEVAKGIKDAYIIKKIKMSPVEMLMTVLGRFPEV